MINKLFTINIYVEISCLIAATYFLFREKNLFWRLSIAYLLIVCTTEIYGRYQAAVLGRPNAWLHNILVLFELAYINTMFYSFTRKYSKLAGPVILFMSAVIFIAYGTEWYLSSPLRFYNVTYTILSIELVVVCLYYYHLFLNQEEFVVLRQHPDFWFAAGVLLFYFGCTVSNFLYEVMSIDLGNDTLRTYTFRLLIILLYTFWSYSFICRYRHRKLQRSSS